MAINTHGLKMTGLKKAASATKNLKGIYDPFYVELFYNTESGEIICNEQYDLGHNAYTVYDNEKIIGWGNICYPATMQEIANAVWDAYKEYTFEQMLNA